ncbi:MAG: Na(+)/H(+) antiporter subunit D [Alphaproteobacteria bacterium]|nr:Na(+)/H(+) antiporter subunit D [Alphaproteobacteria bacterium]
MIEWIHPGLLFVFGAAPIPYLRGRGRQAWLILIPLLAIADVASMTPGDYGTFEFAGVELLIGKVDKLSLVFAWVFSIMSLIGSVYALHVKGPEQHVAAYLYVGSALGVVFAGDWFTLLVSWEIMAFASAYLIFAAGGEAAIAAGFRYLMVHVTGGVLLFGGIVVLGLETGSFLIGPLAGEGGLAFLLILVAFMINAAVPPLNAWLTDAYPEATVTGAVFLSAFTTKTAVYVLMVGFAGEGVLVWVGLYMVFYGIIYALLENDMRRILAYSIINQVGFMVTGIGIGTQMALNGSAAHAFAHIIYKGLLLMSAGAVLHQTGKRKCTDLGGLFRSMPITTVCGIVGAMAISSFPLTSGFVSKDMIGQAAGDQLLALVWFLLAAGSAGVFLHAGIKFPWFVFFQKDSGLRPPDPPWNMWGAMSLFAFLCIGLGVYPAPLYAMLPYAVNYVPYTSAHLVFQFQLLLFSGLAFFLLLPQMKRTLTITLDFDWFYRHFLPRLYRAVASRGSETRRRAEHATMTRIRLVLEPFFRFHRPEGILARSWPTGGATVWVVVLLGVTLVIYYWQGAR